MLTTTTELKNAINNIVRAYSSTTESKCIFAESIKNLEDLKERLESNYVRIAIIGITSSGKSTLLNTILGEQLLPTAVAPSSSKQVVCGYDKERYAKVIFQKDSGRRDRIIHDNILDEISKYGDEKYNPHNREKVEELQVFSPKFKFRRELLFIDTPGLDAYGLTEHEEITMKLVLPSVDMVLFLTNVKCDSDEQNLDFIDRSTTDDKPLVVVQNKIDSIEEKRSKTYGVEKTKVQVRREHFNRLKRLLDNAQKKSVKSAPIVQVSAKLPWDESNLKELCAVMSDQVEQNLERFMHLHLNQFWNRLQQDKEALENLHNDQATREASLASTRRRYDGYENHIKSAENLIKEVNTSLEGKLDSILDKALQLIDRLHDTASQNSPKLDFFSRFEGWLGNSNMAGRHQSSRSATTVSLADKLSAIMNSPSINAEVDEIPSEIKRMQEEFERNLKSVKNYFSSSIPNVQNALQTCCGDLNLQARQIVNIHPVGAFSIAHENYTVIKKYTRTKRVKQDGLLGVTKRFVGSMFSIFSDGPKDWGYDEVQIEEERVCQSLGKIHTDIKINSRNIMKFVSEKMNKFNEDTEFSISKLKEQLDGMRRQLTAQSQSTLTSATINNLLTAVNRLLPSSWERARLQPQPVTNTTKSQQQSFVEKTTKELECTPLEKAVFLWAQNRCLDFTRRYMRQIVSKAKPNGQPLICGWDKEKLDQFRNFFFGDEPDVGCLNLNVDRPPSMDMTGRLVLLIVNAEQRGSTETKLNKETIRPFLTSVCRNGKMVWVMDSVKGLVNWQKPNEDTLAEAFHEMVKMAENITRTPYDFMACDSELYYSVLFHEMYFTKRDTEHQRQQLIQDFGELFHLNNERKNMTGRYLNDFDKLRRR